MYWQYKDRDTSFDISSMVGLRLTKVERDIGDAFFKFTFDNGSFAFLFHTQDCCETVDLEDMVGDFEDLIGFTILVAEERHNDDLPPKDEWTESYTWTFYTFRNIGGSVDLRFYGQSNGYYSETVDFLLVKNDTPKFIEDESYKDLFQ